MLTIEVNGAALPVNAKGMLINVDDWSEEVARVMARQDDFELNDCHWAAIRFLRDYYHEYEVAASPRIMIREVGNKMSSSGKCSGKTLKKLFPKGGCKHACRLAGLPMEYCNSC